MYDNVVTSDGKTYDFPINIELHLELALCPYLFVLVMDEVKRQSRIGVYQKLELWILTLEAKRFRLSRPNTE
jgi:hypothetical protein